MNNFLLNLKEKMENQPDGDHGAQEDKFLNDLISSKSRLQQQSHLDYNKRQGASNM